MLPVPECRRYGASVGFCNATTEVMLAPSSEGARSIAAKREKILNRRRRRNKVLLKRRQGSTRKVFVWLETDRLLPGLFCRYRASGGILERCQRGRLLDDSSSASPPGLMTLPQTLREFRRRYPCKRAEPASVSGSLLPAACSKTRRLARLELQRSKAQP